MSLFRLCLTSVVCIMAAGTVQAGENGALSLKSAIEAALNHNPRVEAQYAKRAEARSRIEEQNSEFFPKIKASAKAGTVRANNATSRALQQAGPTSTSGLGQGSVTISQLLFNGNETRNRIDAAQKRRSAEDTKIRDVRVKLALDTTLAYLDVVRTRQNLEKIKAHITDIEKNIGRIKTKVDSGAQSATALQQARNLLLQVKSRRHKVEKQLATAKARYKQYTGNEPEAGRMKKPVPPAGKMARDEKIALQFAMKNHPRIEAAALRAESKKESLDAEQSALFPDFKGELAYTKRDLDQALGGMLEDKRAVLRMNWDFATGGAWSARVERARQQYNRLEAEKRRVMRSIKSAVKTAYAERRSAKKQLETLRERKEIISKYRDTLETKFEGGQVSLFKLLKIENQLFRLGIQEHNTQYKLISAQYSVLASTGQLYDALEIARADQ